MTNSRKVPTTGTSFDLATRSTMMELYRNVPLQSKKRFKKGGLARGELKKNHGRVDETAVI
jgi:hypothetical protein